MAEGVWHALNHGRSAWEYDPEVNTLGRWAVRSHNGNDSGTARKYTGAGNRLQPQRQGGIRTVNEQVELVELPIFSGMDPDQVSELKSLGWQVEGKEGSPVYYPGDASNLIYVIQKGRVRLSCDTHDGGRLTLEYLEPGGLFGEIALGDAQSRSAKAEAVEPSLFFVLQSDRMMEFIRDCPELMKQLLVLITRRRQRFENRMRQLLFQDAAGRLAYVLLDLYRMNASAAASSNENNRELNFSHQDLADFAGLARPTTTNLLNRFAENGSIRIGQRSVQIEHPQQLSKHFQNSG